MNPWKRSTSVATGERGSQSPGGGAPGSLGCLDKPLELDQDGVDHDLEATGITPNGKTYSDR